MHGFGPAVLADISAVGPHSHCSDGLHLTPLTVQAGARSLTENIYPDTRRGGRDEVAVNN